MGHLAIFTPGFANALLLGLSVGSVWLMAALGLTIIYGTIGVINMAHGEFIMLGAYSAYVLESKLHVPFLLCLPLSFIIVGAIGAVIERVLIRYLYDRPLDTLLASWGISLVLIQIVRLIFGSDPLYLSAPNLLNQTLQIGIFTIPAFRLLVLVLTLAISGAVWIFMQRSRFGMQIRAVTQNREMAAAFGINPRVVYSGAFALGSGLAGVAGCLFGVLNIVLPNMGTQYVVQAFLVVVSGGGTLLGSVVSGAMVGEMQSIFSFFADDTLALCLIFVLIVIFLRIRPQGLIAPTATRR